MIYFLIIYILIKEHIFVYMDYNLLFKEIDIQLKFDQFVLVSKKKFKKKCSFNKLMAIDIYKILNIYKVARKEFLSIL